MLGPLLVAMGLLGFYAFFKGKSGAVLDALTNNGFSTSLDTTLGNLNLGSPVAAGSGSSGGGAGGSTSGATGLYNVPIIGPDGTPGTIQVVAHDSTSALANATQGGNHPTGSPVPV